MAAAFVAPELALEENEAKELTSALAEVNSFYSQTVDPKLLAWCGLIGVAGKIYGPRVGAFMLRRKFEAAVKPRVAPLAGTPVQPRQAAPASVQKQNPPASNIPASARSIFTDPSFVNEVAEGE